MLGMTRPVLLGVMLLACIGTAVAGEPGVRHPFHAAQAKDAPESVVLAVEIPAGSITKYEINEDGLVFVDRFQSMPVAYPANYGSLPRTLAGDGDPLDALVLTREPLRPEDHRGADRQGRSDLCRHPRPRRPAAGRA